jgi:circadian clock protein KaiC
LSHRQTPLCSDLGEAKSRTDLDRSRKGADVPSSDAPASPATEDPPRISTGSPGLDEILGGGLDPRRVYIYEGSPGTGKSTLAMQFLLEGVRQGESGLYITLSETEAEIRTVARRHGWSLDGITLFELVPPETTLDPDQELTVLYPAELELSETTKLVFDRVIAVNPSRIVVDSLSELRLLAQTALRYRRQVLALKHFFTRRDCTVVMLDGPFANGRDPQLHSIVHGVVLLDQEGVVWGAARRRPRVLKMRGIDFKTGFHDFEIRTGGIEIYPRLIASGHHRSFHDGFCLSGNAALDTMLGGGLELGTNALLLGATGVGKSSLALTYALAAAARGEMAAYFAFDEGLATMAARARTLGLPLDAAVDAGLIRITRIDPAEVSPGEFAHLVRHGVEVDGVRVVVIDSLNGYLNAVPEERFLILQMHELLSYLDQVGVLTILTLAQTGIGGPLRNSLDLSYLSDAVLLLQYFEAGGTIRRSVSVLKKRSGTHENGIREVRLSPQGMIIGPPMEKFTDLLGGIPLYSGPTKIPADGCHEDT